MAENASSSSDSAGQTRRLMRGRMKRINWKSNTSGFKQFIKNVPPTLEQENMLRNTPFGWALDIPDNSNLRGLVQNMFDNWDCEGKCFIFHQKKLYFTKNDVSLILGLPDRGEAVPLHVDAASSQLYEQFFTDDDCTNKNLEKLLRTQRSPDTPGGDKLYCQLFILYFFSCAFFTTTSSMPRLPMRSLIDCVDDFDNLGRYNWCEALYEYMTPQMESIGMAVSLRPKPEFDGPSKKPMLKGFTYLLAVWMCEHVRIINPHAAHAFPRILRWRWSASHVTRVKKLVDDLHPEQIDINLIPTQSEFHLVQISSPPRIQLEIAAGETSKQPEVIKTSCQSCKKAEGLISLLTIDVVELTKNLHSTSADRDLIIEEYETKIEDLLHHAEEATRKKDKMIDERDATIAEKESLIAEKDMLITELQLKIQSQDAAGFLTQDIPPTDIMQPTAYARRKTCVTKTFSSSGSPHTPPAATSFENIPKRRRLESQLVIRDPIVEGPSETHVEPQEAIGGPESDVQGENKGKSPRESSVTAKMSTATQSSTDKLQTIGKVKNNILEQASKEFSRKMDAIVGGTLLNLKKLQPTELPVWSTEYFKLYMDSFLTIFDWNSLTHGECIDAYFSVLADECKETDKAYCPSIFCGSGFPEMFNCMYAQAFQQTVKTPANEPIRYIFCPVIFDDHWHLVVVDFHKSEFIHYNSATAKKDYNDQFEETVAFFKNIHPSYYDNWHPGMAEKMVNTIFSLRRVQAPKQSSSLDCAFFLIGYIESLVFGYPPKFKQQDMKRYRFEVGNKIMLNTNFHFK